MTPRRSAAWLALVLSAGITTAQTGGPQLLTVTPPGARQGDTVEVVFGGAALDGPESLLFSSSKVKAEMVAETVALDPKAKKDGGGGGTKTMKAGAAPTAAVKFKVTVPKDHPPGTLDVRVVTKTGVSNPRAFVVGDLPEVAEKESNNDVAEAQRVEIGTTVNGVIAAPTDVDFVVVKAAPGQKLVAACLASTIDSRLQAEIQVYDAAGKPVVSNRGYRSGDALVDFTAASGGDYFLRLSSFAYISGGTDHFYRLTVTAGPWVDSVFPPVADPSGKPVTYTVFGRNLPNAKPEAADGRTYDRATVPFALKGGPAADTLTTDQVVAPTGGALDAVGVRMPLAGAATEQVLLPFAAGPLVLDAGENDNPDKAQAVTVPCDIAGRVEKKNDRDFYSFEAKKGEVLTLELFADRIGAPVDAFFVLSDAKGKVLAEADDSTDTLSPNQFYTKSDDPARYRFAVPADGTFRVMVSTREAGMQAGVRDVYLLRVAKEKPDFRLAVIAQTPHLPEGFAVAKGAGQLLTVYAFRQDGFDGSISLSATGLPPGVTCPPQVVGPGQSKATLVLDADKAAKDWAGFVTVVGSAVVDGAKREHAARPFSVVSAIPGQNNQVPNTPLITRLDRGPGLAVAVRGEAPFRVTPAAATLKVKAGEKAEVALKLDRLKPDVKDAVQVLAASTFGPRQGGGGGGNNPPAPLATFDAAKTDAKVSIDIPATLPPGTYSLALRAVIPDPAKGNNNQPRPPKAAVAVTPVTVEVEGKGVTPKKK